MPTSMEDDHVEVGRCAGGTETDSGDERPVEEVSGVQNRGGRLMSDYQEKSSDVYEGGPPGRYNLGTTLNRTDKLIEEYQGILHDELILSEDEPPSSMKSRQYSDEYAIENYNRKATGEEGVSEEQVWGRGETLAYCDDLGASWPRPDYYDYDSDRKNLSNRTKQIISNFQDIAYGVNDRRISRRSGVFSVFFRRYRSLILIIFACAIAVSTGMLYHKHRRKSQEAPDKSFDPTYRTPTPGSNDYESKVELVALAFNPTWFDTSNGWRGNSFREALAFCESRSRFVCPYDAYCPGGAGQPPFRGVQTSADMWAPTAPSNDTPSLLVGVGSTNSCFQPRGLPSDSDMQNMKYILCCSNHAESGSGQNSNDSQHQQPPNDQKTAAVKQPVAPSYSPSQESTPSPTYSPTSSGLTPEPTAPSIPSSTASELITGKPVIAPTATKFTWFTRSDGYQGNTWKSGMEYCMANIPGGILCGSLDICPDGQGPSSMSPTPKMSIGSPQWVPVLDKYEDWVQVEQSAVSEGLVCFSTHHGDLSNRAELGSSGTEYICCTVDDR